VNGPLFLGLDVGTQATKALLLDASSGHVVARAARSYGLIEGLPPGAAEQHPDSWIEAVREVARRVLQEAAQRSGSGWHAGPTASRLDPAGVASLVAGVGVSGQQHGLVVLDGQDRVVRPAKLWCDTSTAAEAAELSAAFGRSVPTGYTASKILWLKRHEPRSWERVRRVLLPHDYVNLRLTGEATMEAGDASGTGVFDPHGRRFQDTECRAIDERLPDLLPPLLEPGRPAGRLSPDGAALLGLPEGVLVAAGGGDNMLSAIGAGATHTGVVVASLGTSGTVFTRTDHAVVDPDGLIAPFCDSAGGWLPLLCVMNCTNVTEAARSTVEAMGGGAPVDLGQLTERAAAEPAGCDGLLWLPYLQGERVPDLPGASGVLAGLTGAGLRSGRLFRAALEGVALNLGWGVQRLIRLGLAVDAVRVVGGGSRNPLWRQILADVLEGPVTRLLEPESAALGGALQAAWTARLEEGESIGIDEVVAPCVALADETERPEPSRSALYREAGERFRDLARRVFDAR
jgi:xylulokinase